MNLPSWPALDVKSIDRVCGLIGDALSGFAE